MIEVTVRCRKTSEVTVRSCDENVSKDKRYSRKIHVRAALAGVCGTQWGRTGYLFYQALTPHCLPLLYDASGCSPPSVSGNGLNQVSEPTCRA